MARKKNKPQPAPEEISPGRWTWISATSVRALFMVVGALAALSFAVVASWEHSGAFVSAGDQYQVRLDEMVVAPHPPSWIRSDIRAEVIRDSGLDERMSLLDKAASRRIAEAFSLHPWVAEARVTLDYPASVHVLLRYRRPVAMVEVEQSPFGELLPIDIEGFHLPGRDFSPAERRGYPLLVGVRHLPIEGQQSGTPYVLAGARLAAVLLDSWQELQLARIEPVDAHAATDPHGPGFALRTKSGARIIWGKAPASADDGTAAEKLVRLRRLIQEGLAAGPAAATTVYDLRGDSGISTRTARDPALPPDSR